MIDRLMVFIHTYIHTTRNPKSRVPTRDTSIPYTRNPKSPYTNTRIPYSGIQIHKPITRNPNSGIINPVIQPEITTPMEQSEGDWCIFYRGFHDSGISNPGISGKARVLNGILNSIDSGMESGNSGKPTGIRVCLEFDCPSSDVRFE